MLAFILMIIFLGLSVGLYVAGILVVERVQWSVQLDNKIQQAYNWVLQYGSQEQRKAAQAAVQKKDIDNLQALVGMDLAVH